MIVFLCLICINYSNPIAHFETSMGGFDIELFLDVMPITVSNFVDLANSGFYNGLSFHRVIENFMLQFGCPYSKNPSDPRAGTGGPPPNSRFKNLKTGQMMFRDSEGNIPDEFAAKISNDIGTVAMANTGQPNTGGSQIFINVHHNDYLDWWSGSEARHPVFGKVIRGMDLVNRISKVQTDQGDKPMQPIIVRSVTVNGVTNNRAGYAQPDVAHHTNSFQHGQNMRPYATFNHNGFPVSGNVYQRGNGGNLYQRGNAGGNYRAQSQSQGYQSQYQNHGSYGRSGR